MLVIKEMNLDLGKQINRDLIPFEYEMTSNFKESVYVTFHPTCGCTSVIKDIFLTPNQILKLECSLNKRPHTGQVTKSIGVKVYPNKQDKRILAEYKLTFTTEIVDKI